MNLFLLHGLNKGLMHEISQVIIEKYNLKSKKVFFFDEIKKNKTAIINELSTADFFANDAKIIQIFEYESKIFPSIKEVFEYLKSNNKQDKIIITCEELDKKDQINALIKESGVVAIKCDLDEITDTENILRNFIEKNQIHCADEKVIVQFAELCSGDRDIINNELQKLTLFLENAPNKTIDQSYLVNLYDHSSISNEEIIDNVLLKKYIDQEKLNKNLANSSNILILIRNFFNHVQNLYIKSCNIKAKKSTIEDELKYVAFRRKNSVKWQILNIDIQALNQYAKKLCQLENVFMTQGEELAIVEFKRFMFEIISSK